MKLKILTFVTIAAVSVINQANAGYYMSANRFLSLCESNSVADQNVCVGYVLGVTDAAQMLDSETDMKRYCISNNVTSSQLEKTAITYMKNNPGKLDKQAAYYVLVSLREAFPCKQ